MFQYRLEIDITKTYMHISYRLPLISLTLLNTTLVLHIFFDISQYIYRVKNTVGGITSLKIYKRLLLSSTRFYLFSTHVLKIDEMQWLLKNFINGMKCQNIFKEILYKIELTFKT